MKLHRPAMNRGSARRGYTLLELLLASVAAIMLLSALYFSFDVTVNQTQYARDAAGTEDLIRGINNRFAMDISGVLAPQPAQSGGTAGMQLPYTLASLQSGATSTGGSSTGNTTGAKTTGAMTTGGGASGSNNNNSSSSANSSNTPLLGSGMVIPLQSGVIGAYQSNPNMLILFTSRVPDIFTTTGPNSLAQLYNSQTSSSNNNTQIPADLRRVVYWLGSSGSGLYRQEIPWVTGVDSWNLSDIPVPESSATLIADEVKGITFEYLDPMAGWVDSWDGTGGTSPPYSMTPGPPNAIRITLNFEFGNPKGGSPIKSTFQQVYPVYTAPGQTTVTLYNTAAGGASSSSSGSNSNVVGAKTTTAKTVGAATTTGK